MEERHVNTYICITTSLKITNAFTNCCLYETYQCIIDVKPLYIDKHIYMCGT